MGDDPLIPSGLMHTEASSGAGGSAATGGHNITNNITNFGRTGMVILVVCVGLSIGLSIGALVAMVIGQSAYEKKLTLQVSSVERRVMDRASLAEREARIAQDKYWYLKSAVEARGIKVEEH